MMKLIIAIISDVDNDAVSQALMTSGFRATRVASTGGFFRRGSTTLMIGIDDHKVDTVIDLIRDHTTTQEASSKNRATLFVLNIARFSQI